MSKLPVPDALYQSISELIRQARQQVQRSVNSVMVQSYWHVGRLIIEHEQQGESRAAYGKQQLGQLSARLTDAFGKGFDVTNLRNMRRFYQAFPIQETVSLELGWSQYNLLSRIENPAARSWYAQEAITQNWSVRALERQIGEVVQAARACSTVTRGHKGVPTLPLQAHLTKMGFVWN